MRRSLLGAFCALLGLALPCQGQEPKNAKPGGQTAANLKQLNEIANTLADARVEIRKAQLELELAKIEETRLLYERMRLHPKLKDARGMLVLDESRPHRTENDILIQFQPDDWFRVWHRFKVDFKEPIAKLRAEIAGDNPELRKRLDAATKNLQRLHKTERWLVDELNNAYKALERSAAEDRKKNGQR